MRSLFDSSDALPPLLSLSPSLDAESRLRGELIGARPLRRVLGRGYPNYLGGHLRGNGAVGGEHFGKRWPRQHNSPGLQRDPIRVNRVGRLAHEVGQQYLRGRDVTSKRLVQQFLTQTCNVFLPDTLDERFSQ